MLCELGDGDSCFYYEINYCRWFMAVLFNFISLFIILENYKNCSILKLEAILRYADGIHTGFHLVAVMITRNLLGLNLGCIPFMVLLAGLSKQKTYYNPIPPFSRLANVKKEVYTGYIFIELR